MDHMFRNFEASPGSISALLLDASKKLREDQSNLVNRTKAILISPEHFDIVLSILRGLDLQLVDRLLPTVELLEFGLLALSHGIQ